MPNEFKVKNGLIVDQGGLNVTGSTAISGSVTVTGSVTATNFTGSLFGTASWANNVVSASYADNGGVTQIVAGTNVTISPTSGTGSVTINATAGAAFPYTGSAAITGSINLTGSIFVTQSYISTVDYIDFTTNPGTLSHLEGRIHWDDDRKTLELDTDVNNFMINVGHMAVLRGRNTNSFTLTKGTVVYINGNSGQFATFATASWETDPSSAYTIGLIAQDISPNNYGYAVTDGEIIGVNTNAFAPATLLYLSSSGQYTDVVPTAPNHTVRLGQVVVQSTNGILQVKVDNGYELGELHDIRDTTTTSSYGDLLVKSGSVWINSKQLTGSYGLTGSLTATTINTTYLTASGNNYPTNSGTSSFFLQTDGAGTLSWNYVRSVLESVKNVGATTLVKGTPVYVTSSVGNTAEVVKADAASASLMPATYILNETLTAGQQGLGIVLGFINNIDTSTFAESDEVYVAAGGGYTNIQPTGSTLIQPLGTVVRVDNTNGSIMVSNSGLTNSLPNLNPGHAWIGNNNWLPLAIPTSSFKPYIDNIITVGLSGSATGYNVIKTAVDSITDASENNTYTVRVYPGVYIEDTMTIPSYVTVKGDSSTSTIVSASNPSASIFVMSDQTMVIDMQIQGSTGPGASAIYYSSPTTPQRNAIAYAENIRFGTNYTNATCEGSGSGNCILQCSNVKYGGYTDAVSQKSFDIGFRVTGSGGSIGRMQLRNVTSTNGGVAGTDNNQIFALADAPGCTFIVNGCLLTRATGTARGTGFKVYNGGSLRLTGVNFQRWINGIWAPQTGSAPSIDAVALNFENCTYDVLIEHTGSTGKISGTDTFLKTIIPATASLYEVGQDPRRLTVAKKGGDFTSISASVAWITDSSADNRYIIEVGPGQFTEKTIDLVGKPYVSIVGSNIQTTQIFPSSSNQHLIKMGVNNEVSFLSLANVGSGYSALYIDDIGDFAQAHKVSIYDCDRGITVDASTTDTQFYGEYIDINGTFSYGVYVSSSNGVSSYCNLENYYLFPSASATIGNYAVGPSSSLNLYTSLFKGDSTANSIAIKLENGSTLEASGLDIQDWDYGYVVPNTGNPPTFRVVGSMIHDSSTYDFDVQKIGTVGRYQGVSDHTKINNVSEDFYWNFLDDIDGENDITRKLSVTFADGTHTDATTLIFKGSPMGVMQGGEITISGSLTITTAAGFGYLQDAVSTDIYKRIDWINTNLTLTANTNNYIYLNDNGTLSASGTSPDSTTNIILGRVVTNNTGIEFIDQSPFDGEHMSNKLSKFNREALGPVFAEGSIVTEDVTPFKLDVTQGSYYLSENNFLPAGTSSINLTQYYQSASVWARFTSSIVPNNVYASGSQLIAMSASYYTKHTVYLVGESVDEEYFLVINDNQYASLVQAEGASLPTIPTYFNDGVVPLAAVYVQSGSANITQIEDIRPIIGFRAAGVNASAVHGNLLGLTADDHLQYLRVDGFRQMTGDLGLGGNDLYNFALISGSAITASVATITTINATSITGSLLGNASSATTASYVLNAVSASFATTAVNATTASYVLNAVSASFASTASFAPNYVLNSATSSMLAPYLLISQTSSFATTGSNTFRGNQTITGSVNITGSTTITGSLNVSLGITGSLFGTASWANNATTASYVLNAVSSSFASTASSADNFTVRGTLTAQTIVAQTITSSTDFVTGSTRFGSLLANTHQFTGSVSITGSLSVNNNSVVTSNQTSSFVQNSQTSSFVTNTQTSSFVLNSQTSSMSVLSASYASGSTSASFASTAALAPLYVLTSATSSMLSPYVLNSQTSSFVQNSQTSSFVTNAQTSSFVLNSQTASMTVATASFATSSLSASYAANGGVTQITAGTNVTISPTSGLGNVTINATAGAAFPYTGSALITGSLVITGSTTSTLGFTGSLQGTASWATNAISSSYPIAVSGSTLYSTNPLAGGFNFNRFDAIFLGNQAGYSAIDAYNSNFLGYQAGYLSLYANDSNFLGYQAGFDSYDAQRSNFLGYRAGYSASEAFNSNFIGENAGINSSFANNSNFIGPSAGGDAINASNSNFLGNGAGYAATSASYSTLIGYHAGYNTNGGALGIKSNNIIIGTNITLPDGTKDSINLGAIIFATGSYAEPTGDAFTGTSNGRVGINVVNPQYTLDVSGSGNFTNGVTASLFGTASWATNAITSSYPIAVSGSNLYSVAPFSNIPQNSTSSIYIGENAGTGSGFGIKNAVAIGNNAGGLQYSPDGVYIGTNAGYNAFYGDQSIFIGKNSGKNSGNGRNSVFIGNDAGKDNLDGDRAVNIGLEAGVSSSAFDTVFIGYGAGGYSYSNHGIYLGQFAGDSTTGDYNIAMGRFAGLNAFNSSNVIFIGQSAGNEATDASNSIFMGLSAGYSASNASNSIFIGNTAGTVAVNASNSIILGERAGYISSNNLIGRNNIIIGTKVTLENGRQDSINIGGIIFGTGSYYSVAAGNAFSGSANGRIGINVVNPQYTLDVSGSGNFTNGVTASLFGTASWANNSLTASIATSASFAATASFAPLYVLTSQTSSMTVATASFATSSLSASFASTASSADNFTVRGTLTAQTIIAQTITSSTDFVTGSTRFGSIITNTHQFTGSVSISGSLTINGNDVVTNNLTSSFVQNSQTSSMTVATASFATSSLSSSFAATASFAPLYVLNSQTSSFVQNSQTSSFVTNAQTASMTVATASFATSSLSASFAATASFAPLYVLTSQTSSFVLNSQTSSMSVATASFATSSLSASYASNGGVTQIVAGTNVTISPTGGSGSITINATAGAAFPYTGSAIITGSLVITGSTTSTLGFTGSLFGTASYVTGSIFTSANPALSASYALTASYALNSTGGGLTTKAGSVVNSSFAGNPKKATVTFSTAFPNTSYAIVITGEDARSWTIESKAVGSFVINANSNTALAGTTYWIATAYGES